MFSETAAGLQKKHNALQKNCNRNFCHHLKDSILHQQDRTTLECKYIEFIVVPSAEVRMKDTFLGILEDENTLGTLLKQMVENSIHLLSYIVIP